MQPSSIATKDFPLNIVGSTVFGRYPNISIEQTFNMIISDNRLVDYSGYSNALQNSSNPIPSPVNPVGVGRGNYHSVKLNALIVVVGDSVFLIDNSFQPLQIGRLNTVDGDVFIAEDVQGHLAFCDESSIWIYTHSTGTFVQATVDGSAPLDFKPGYVSYHNGRFLSVDLNSSTWRLSDPSPPSLNSYFPNDAQHVGTFQTKANNPVAAIPFPGKGNLIFVMGSTVTELWVDVGAALFPYERSTGVDIDYGCVSADTIAVGDEFVVWVAYNAQSGPFLAYSTGGVPQRISNDGIDFELSRLTTPNDSHGFLFRQDGHLIYQMVFPTDNKSYIFDFTTQKFFTVTDEEMNYHIAKRVAYFNNTYYFVSLRDGNLYEFDSNITQYNYGYNSNGTLIVFDIPRVRVTNTFRLPDNSNFIANQLDILVEQGVQLDTPRIDISVSRDGGQSFGNYVGMNLNSLGTYRNRFTYYGMGMCNQFTLQLRLWSNSRFVLGNATLGINQ